MRAGNRHSPVNEGYQFGVLAQLGERLHGMQEVTGAVPVGSTRKEESKAAGTVSRLPSSEHASAELKPFRGLKPLGLLSMFYRGYSSARRASRSQREGRECNSRYLH